MKITGDLVRTVMRVGCIDDNATALEVIHAIANQPVEITDRVVEAFGRGWYAADASLAAGKSPVPPGTRRRAGLRAALEAAGFTVKP